MADELRRSRDRVFGSITRLKNTLITILQTDPSDASDDQIDLLRLKIPLLGEKQINAMTEAHENSYVYFLVWLSRERSS